MEKRVTNMTVGNPLKLIALFAIPLLIGNIFQQVYTMMDTTVVGYFIGDSAISAIGASASLYSLLLNLIINMNSGYGIIITRKFGANNIADVKKSIAGSIILNIILIIIISLFSTLFLKNLLYFMQTPADIFNDAYNYMLVLCIGLFTTATYNMFAGILRSLGNSRIPLYFLILASIINILLDLLLVGLFKLPIYSAALATVISQGISAIFCGIYVIKNYKDYLPSLDDFKCGSKILYDLFITGFSFALMICVVNLGTVIFQRTNNSLGEEIIAAHSASRRIIEMLMQPHGTIASATSIFISQNYGVKNYKRIKEALKKIFLIEVLYGIFAVIIVFTLGSPLLRGITSTENNIIIDNGLLCLYTNVIFYPILGLLLCLRTSMQAMGSKVAPVLSSVLELIIKIIGAFVLIPNLGYLGTCITEPLSWVIMSIFLFTAYFIQRKKIFKEFDNK